MNDQAFNQVLESLLDGEPRDFTPESLSPEQGHELIFGLRSRGGWRRFC
jgi:hypothetical protein